MKHHTIDARIDFNPDLPSSIEKGILGLYGVSSIEEIAQDEKDRIRKVLQGFYVNTSETNYNDIQREYALYYLPINFYKIWRPLMDVLLTDRLPARCKILEFGAGPGSATFGLIELYKYLAYDNRFTEFSLDLTLVEKDCGFIDIFKKLYLSYSPSLPENLTVDITYRNEDAYQFVKDCAGNKYDLIIESNMLNPNESICEEAIKSLVFYLKLALSPHSSVILIEPAKPKLTVYLRKLKKYMHQQGMHCYSPCCCPNPECNQFASARIDISEIGIYSTLHDNGFIRNYQKAHSFEYAVYRNDELPKYTYEVIGNELSNLINQVGKRIKFKAFILTFANETEDAFTLKICDGSLCNKNEVWLTIPKSILVEDGINCLTSGRGGLVYVKNAIVEGPRNIKCVMSTQLKIYR